MIRYHWPKSVELLVRWKKNLRSKLDFYIAEICLSLFSLSTMDLKTLDIGLKYIVTSYQITENNVQETNV